MTCPCLALSALRWKYGPRGWRVFISDRGRWWATTTGREAIDYKRGMIPVLVPDAVDSATPAGLAAELERRSGP